MADIFSRSAQWIGIQLGKPYTFATACFIVIAWAASGPVFGYSDTWQLVINTGTTIITFLMVFLLQHTQNRDTRVIQLKLDELIRANKDARNALLGLEQLTDDDTRRIQEKFAVLAKSCATPDELRGVQKDLVEARKDVERAEDKIERVVVDGGTTTAARDVEGGSNRD
jgi:low affinity Fe/Cu permease